MAVKAIRFDIVRLDEDEQRGANNSRGCVEIVTSAHPAMTDTSPSAGTRALLTAVPGGEIMSSR
jgi:hypothetical protein